MRTAPLQRSPLAAAMAFALSTFLAPAHADTIIDHANGYTLTASGALQRFTSLGFDDLGRVIAVPAVDYGAHVDGDQVTVAQHLIAGRYRVHDLVVDR